ncbi:MAG: hypothetical protein D6732_08250 [Methanobacteriota archaeon]|nr:MAG: hypothetical protein D6732_08250 [Euryarchaeota archaeon]
MKGLERLTELLEELASMTEWYLEYDGNGGLILRPSSNERTVGEILLDKKLINKLKEESLTLSLQED